MVLSKTQSKKFTFPELKVSQQTTKVTYQSYSLVTKQFLSKWLSLLSVYQHFHQTFCEILITLFNWYVALVANKFTRQQMTIFSNSITILKTEQFKIKQEN